MPPITSGSRADFWGNSIRRTRTMSSSTTFACAPRNGAGKVEYQATFTLLRPTDPTRASGVMWYEVPNRGNSPLNPRPSADALAAGHVILSSGWQGDLASRPGQ